MPEYIEASSVLGSSQSTVGVSSTKSILIGEFDCSDNGDYCANEWGVYSYPQLRFYRPGGKSLSIPYYQRDKTGIVNFANRVLSPKVVQTAETSSELRKFLDQPKFGYLISIILVGETLPSDIVDLVGRDFCNRFQFVHVNRPEILPIDIKRQPSESLWAIMVPSKQNILPGTLVSYPTTSVVDAAQFGDWIRKTPYPGIWKIEDELFQYFSDQSVFKVIISQDPLIASSNRTIESAVADCDTKNQFSFGIVNGPSLSTILNEFGVRKNLGTLVLNKEPLDFSIYYSEDFESIDDDLCTGLRSIIGGEMKPQYRGNFFTRLSYRYTKLLAKYGMDTELWRVGLIIGLMAIGIFIMIIAGSWVVRAMEPASMKAAMSETWDKKKNE
jgi:hypothetical protein